MKVIMNKLMEDMIQKKTEKKIVFTPSNFESIVNSNFIKKYDCIIIDRNKEDISLEEFEKVIEKYYGDKIGYEASCNETLINMYIQNDEELSAPDIIPIAFSTVKVWSSHLKIISPNDKICFIIICNENQVNLRFHKVREKEGWWLEEDLEKYNEPVGYIII